MFKGRFPRDIISLLLIGVLLTTQLLSPTAAIGAPQIKRYGLVAILVEESLWQDTADYRGLSGENGKISPSSLRYRFERYALSVQESLPLTKVKILLVNRNESTVKVSRVLEKLYREGDGEANESNSLTGIVLIGDLPVPVVKKGEKRFPSLFPYTDFDDPLYVFRESSSDFEFSTLSSNPQVEIWHGVIKPPQSGVEGGEMLASYFDKNHLYREGDSRYADFDQKIFYGDIVREVQSLNGENFLKYQNLQDLAAAKMYFTGNKETARSLYQKAQAKVFGFGDGLDNDGDGKIDEDPINGFDDDGDKLVDEDDGDPQQKIDNDRDGKVDEDGIDDNDADRDGKTDEDGKGDANGDGCPGICLTDDDGDQLDLDGDRFPDGAEIAAKTDPRDPEDYPSGGLLFGFYKIPDFNPDPSRKNPRYKNPERGNWTDEDPRTDDKNCYDAVGKFHPEWDDDEDGFCDEDGLNDNDADRDGKSDEDSARSESRLPAEAFSRLPDIAAHRVIGNYLADFPQLLGKYIGEVNDLTAYSGRWNNGEAANVDDFSSLLGKRDAANRLYFLLLNTAVEKAVDVVAAKAQSKTPIVVSARLASAAVTIEDQGKNRDLPRQNPNLEFWSGNNDRINGVSYESIADPLECSLFRGTSAKTAPDSKLVLFNKIYNPVPPRDQEGKFIEESEGDYGWCLAKYASAPEVCIPEEASRPVLDFSGAREEQPADAWFESFTDWRACFDLKEKRHFEALTRGGDDLKIGDRTVKSIPRYRDIVRRNMDKSRELDECFKNNKNNPETCRNIVVPALTKTENRPQFLDRYKPLREIVVFSERGARPFTITLADVAQALKISERDFASINEYLFNTGDPKQKNRSLTVKNPLGPDHFVKELRLNIDNLEYARQGGFLFVSGAPLLLPTLVKHKAPFSHEGKKNPPVYDVDWVLSRQSATQTAAGLPIDSPRYFTFKDRTGQARKFLYPDFFSSRSVTEAREQVKVLANQLANLTGDPVDAANILTVFEKFVAVAGLDLNAEVSQLVKEGVVDPQRADELKNLVPDQMGTLAENIAWKSKNIDEKHQYVLRSYLSVADQVGGVNWRRLPPQAKGDASKFLEPLEALGFNRRLITDNLPFLASRGYEAAYLVFSDAGGRTLEYRVNPDFPDQDEDMALRVPPSPVPSPASETATTTGADLKPIFLLAWFEHIIDWVKSLKFEVAVTMRCQYEGQDIVEAVSEQFEAQKAEVSTRSPNEERDFIAAERPVDSDGDGIPDAAFRTKSLELTAESKVIPADDTTTSRLTVIGLDERKQRNGGDGFGKIELQIISGDEHARIVSENPKILAGGRAEFLISGSESAGTVVFRARALNRKDSLVSNDLSVQVADRRLKLSSFLKKNPAGLSSRPLETLKDVLIYNAQDRPLARIHSDTGRLEILNSDYEFLVSAATKNRPFQVRLEEKASRLPVAAIFYGPFSKELRRVSALPLLGSGAKGSYYRLLAVADYAVTESETALELKRDNLLVARFDREGQIFLAPDFRLRLNSLSTEQYQSFTVSDDQGRDLFEFSVIADFANVTLIDRADDLRKLLADQAATPPPAKPVSAKSYFFSSAHAAAPVLDQDGDGLADFTEFLIGTRSDQADSDGDGVDDRTEIFANTDPLRAGAQLFADLKTGDREFTAIIDLYLKGILRGYPDGNFRPRQNITREEFVKVNLSSACVDCARFSPTVKERVLSEYSRSPFPDQNFTPDLKICVAEGKSRGIVSGYRGGPENGYFLPQRTISRAEAAKIILLTAGLEIPTNPLSDRPWFYNYVIGAKQALLYSADQFPLLSSTDFDRFKIWFEREIKTQGSFVAWLNQPISRGEFALMVSALFRAKNCWLQDSDDDGLSDSAELNQYGTNPFAADTDGGGVFDLPEILRSSDPLNPADDFPAVATAAARPAHLDDDNDGLSNGEEKTLGTGSDMADTDQGGVSDYEEVKIFGTDPLNRADDAAATATEGFPGGFSAASYYLRYEKRELPGDNEKDALAEELIYTEELPADGSSELWLRAEVQSLAGITEGDENATAIRFQPLAGSENLAQIQGAGSVTAIYGRADARLRAGTKSGVYRFRAEALNEDLPSGIGEISLLAGPPTQIVFQSEGNQFKADSLSRLNFSLRFLDRFGNLADGENRSVTLDIDGPAVIENLNDEDGTRPGINFTVFGGEQSFALRSTTVAGAVKLTARYSVSPDAKEIIAVANIDSRRDLRLAVSAPATLSADGTTLSPLTVNALDPQGAPLADFSGPVQLELSDARLGSLTSSQINLVNGVGSTQIRSGTKNGELTVTALAPLFEAARFKIKLEPPLTPASLKLFASARRMDSDLRERVEIFARVLDSNGNSLENLSGGQAKIRATEATKRFVRFPAGQESPVKNGLARFVVAPAALTGPINLVVDFEKLPSATIGLEVINKISARDFYENPPAAMHITLLGTAGGAFYEQDYLAGSMVFSGGKTQAATTLLSSPSQFEEAARLLDDGRLPFVNEGKLTLESVFPSDTPPILNLLDPETAAIKASVRLLFDGKAVLSVLSDQDLSGKPTGIYVRPLSDRLTVRSSPEQIIVGGEKGALVSVEKTGAIKKMAKGLDLSFAAEQGIFVVASASEGRIAEVRYHFQNRDFALTESSVDLKGKSGRFLTLSPDLSPFLAEPIFTGNSLRSLGGYGLVDGRYRQDAAGAPGLGAVSLEDAETATGVGFGEGNKHMLLLAAGQTVGEANKPYASEIGVVIGDPTLAFKKQNPVSKTGYRGDIGVQILAGAEPIQSLTQLDYNGDSLTDVFVAYENGQIVLLENQSAAQRFKNRGPILHLVNGIKSLAKGDLDRDGREDLLIVSKDSCRAEEVCVYWYRNTGGNFLPVNLELKSSQKIQDLQVADLNADGWPDLVVADFDNRVTAFYNDKGRINTSGQLIASLDLTVDENANLARSVALRYAGLPEPAATDPAAPFNYRDLAFTLPDSAKNASAEAKSFNAIADTSTFKLRAASASSSELYRFIFADADPAFKTSVKKARDLNGAPLRDGDKITYQITLKNSGSLPIKDLWFSDSIPANAALDFASVKCLDCGDKKPILSRGENSVRPFVLRGLSIPAGAVRVIEYTVSLNEKLPKYNITVGNNLLPDYPADDLPDILVRPENNTSGRVLVYHSAGKNADGTVKYARYLSTPKPAPVPSSIPFLNAQGQPDFGPLNADGIPKQVAEQAVKATGDSDGDLIPDFLDFSNGELSLNFDKITETLNKALEQAGKFLEDGLRFLQCGGSCLPFPISVSWLSPGPFNVLGIPLGFDPGTPIVGAVVPYPPFVCFGPACYASTIFRFYVSPTVPPANLGMGICLGAYPGGQCWAFSIDLLKALNLCEIINQAISDALAAVSNVISSVSGHLVIMGGGGGNQGNPNDRDNAIGITNQNLGKFNVHIPQKNNYRIAGFPAPITDWFSKQTDEVVDKLSDLPDIHVILPDLAHAFKPQSEFKSPQNLRDVLTWLNSIPILEIETKRISLKVPVVSRSEIAAFEHDATQWVENVKSQLKVNGANLRPNIQIGVQKLLSQIEYNVSTLQEYKRLFKKIKDFRSAQSKYINQVICYIDAIHEMLVGWIKKNEQRIKVWIKAIEDIKEKFTDWKLIIDIPASYVESCDTCQTERFTLTELIAKLFVAIPTPPIIQLPKWPDIIMDFSQIEAGLKIVWPEIDFQPLSLQLPKLPQIDLTSPRLTAAFDAGKSFPDIPLLPAPPEFPLLPNLPPLPVLELPVLPRPPEIPGITPALKISLQGLKIAFKILCLLKTGLIPTQETLLKTRFEQLAARNLDAVLPIDTAIKINWPNINYSYLDSIEIKGRLNFAANITLSPIYDSMKQFADFWNKNLEEGVGTINKQLDVFSQLMQGIFNVPGELMPRSLDLDLNKVFYQPNAPANRFAPLLAQNSDQGASCKIPDNLANITGDDPMVNLMNRHYADTVNQIEKLARAINQETAEFPLQLSGQGKTIAYLDPSDPALNRSHRDLVLSEEYFADAPALNNLTRLRNGLIAYARDFDSANFQIEKSADLDSALAYFRPQGEGLRAALQNFTPASDKADDKTEYLFRLTETREAIKAQGERILLAQNRSDADAANKAQAAALSAITGESAASTGLYQPRLEGIFLYNHALNINERLIDYTGEIHKAGHLLDLDFDADGDYDKIYSYGGDAYLKENFLKTAPAQFYSGRPTVAKISDFKTPLSVPNDFRVGRIGNNKLDLVWEQSAAAAGYQISLYANSEAAYSSSEPPRERFEILDFNSSSTSDSPSSSSSASPAAVEYLVQSFTGTVKIDGAARHLLDSTRLPARAGDYVQAIKDSVLIIDDNEDQPLAIQGGNYLVLDPALLPSADSTVRLDQGEAILLRPAQREVGQALTAKTMLLPGDLLQVPRGGRLVFDYFGRLTPTFSGPGVVRIFSLGDRANPALDFSLANGNHFARLNSFSREGDLSDSSAPLLLTPQICSDRTPPVANTGHSEKEVPLFGKITLDASASFDADSPITAYNWDLDANQDSDGDGIGDNDRDHSGRLVELGPFTTVTARRLVLTVIDTANNAGRQIIDLRVVVPALDLNLKENGGYGGQVNPPQAGIPVTLLRRRGTEPWREISTVSSSPSSLVTSSSSSAGVYLTDRDGRYQINDFDNRQALLFRDSLNQPIAVVDPLTGAIELKDGKNHQVEVLAADGKLPTRIEIKNTKGEFISRTYLIIDANNDVKIAPPETIFSVDNANRFTGVHVKPLVPDLRFEAVSGADLLYGGGVVVRRGEKIVARIQPDGNIYLLDSIYRLVLKNNVAADSPLVILLQENTRAVAEIFPDLDLSRPVNLSNEATGIIAKPQYAIKDFDWRQDLDGDGMPDSFELLYGFNPASYLDRAQDPDGDGLPNWEEFLRNTNPLVADSDKDGASDKEENQGLEAGAVDSPFADITPASPYFTATQKLFRQGYLQGYRENGRVLFKPDQLLSRAEYTKIMLGLLCIEPRPDSYEDPPVFTDITRKSTNDPWYYALTKEARLRGFITGYLREIDPESGLAPFRPQQSINVAEGVKIILEALEKEQVLNLALARLGAEGEAWYLPFIAASLNLGDYLIDSRLKNANPYLLTPAEAATPDRPLGRGDFAVIAMRVLQARNCYLDDENRNGLPDGWEKQQKITAADGDNDGDGLSNALEYRLGSDPNNPDTDGGGVADGVEYYRGRSVLNPADDRTADRDGDGLDDDEEKIRFGTDPNLADTDGGGVNDGAEIKAGTNPLFAPDDFDRDIDGLTDAEEKTIYRTNPDNPDTDGGGIGDGLEVSRGGDPLLKADDYLDPRATLPQGVNFSLPECRTCPCPVAVENSAQLLEGDRLMTVIYDGKTIHARSNILEIKLGN